MASLRTKEGEERYSAYKKSGGLGTSCALCIKEPLEKFSYWKIIRNDFPYDRIATTHHMLVPLRHAKEMELTKDEYEEYLDIRKKRLEQGYDYVMTSTARMLSIPQHFHFHCVIVKDQD